jgi:V8-like Glu-specific endopeptidase
MMKFIGRLFLAALMTVALVKACTAEPSGTVTARLDFDYGTCSGTIVAKDVILSAAHCFDNEDELAKLLGVTPPPVPTSVLVDGYKVYIEDIVDDGADHALVKVIFNFKDHATLGPPPAVGCKVHYWGNAAKQTNTYREGYVASYRHGDMLMDVNGFFGDSGSGIFDGSGKLVGVISFISPHRSQGLTFSLMGAYPLEFTPLQYSMMGVSPP